MTVLRCSGCRTGLAPDQRYCVRCGRRHGEPFDAVTGALSAAAPAVAKSVNGFDGNFDDKIQILSGARFSPCPFCDRTADQIINSRSFQSVYHQLEESSNIQRFILHGLYARCNAIRLASASDNFGFSWRIR